MLNVIVIGLGPIGIAAATAVSADKGMKLVALVDSDSAKLGKHLADFHGPHQQLHEGPAIVASLDDVPAKADVAILATASHFDKIAATLRECMSRKLHVVSSCEEMAWPRFRHPKLSDTIDAEAKTAGVSLLGTGVNPGFVMDLLPVVLSSMVTKVTGVRVVRKVNASTRRLPLQRKVGATMTVEHFNGLAREGRIGHMGIGESVAMIAAGLGHHAKPADVKITLDPVIAEAALPSAVGEIKPGQVRGMHNTAKWADATLSIELDLTMAVGLSDPADIVELAGPVPLSLTIAGSTPGDTATVASLVNCARLLPNARPGLHTMLDLPAAGCRPNS